MPSKTIKKPADHKVQPGDQTFLHPHSNKEQQQDQSSKHLNTPAKAKCSYTTKHPNYHKATDSTCTKDIYSIYIPSAQKKNTTSTYSTITSKKFQLQPPLQTIHYKTISIQQWKSSLYKTFTILQQTSPTANHHKTITDLQQLPPSATTTTSSIYKTIPTDTRTNLLSTSHFTAPDTTIHHVKIENTGFYKDISYKTFIHIRTIYNKLLSDIYTVNSSIFCIITNNFHRFGHYKTITATFNHIIYFNICNTIFLHFYRTKIVKHMHYKTTTSTLQLHYILYISGPYNTLHIIVMLVNMPPLSIIYICHYRINIVIYKFRFAIHLHICTS